MKQHDRGGAGRGCLAKHLSRMHDAGVERADREHRRAQDAMLCVEQQHAELFDRLVAELRQQKLGDRARIPQLRPRLSCARERSASEPICGQHLRRSCGADPRELSQFPVPRPHEAVQSTRRQQRIGQVERARAGPPVAEHDRQQFVVAQRGCAEAMRVVWGLVIAKFLSDGAWFFYSFWLPKYLLDVHEFNTKDVGAYAWIPYAASGIGSLIGGAFSSWLLHRGFSLNLSRKFALGASAVLMPWVFLVTMTDVRWAIVLFSIAFFGQQSWSTLVMTLPADLFPRRLVGSVAGLVGFGGAMGGVASNFIFGNVLDAYKVAGELARGYEIVFAITSSLHILAFLLILATVRRVEPVQLENYAA